ncbi:formyltransferase/hydrolase complex Fhc subunit C [Methanobrevibacter cuticularis]|uniref:formylmethanofuran dehydrogenase n=1 Tax=Methanobrevibacter cuticularis TaxID=47311 RepID=A0A166DFA3_9EURY|nr:formylmethanofuran dehydrogenase subunit C [Methanobrevibacter cuticularis]KZX15538.1 formyltransferase/hydrolase complex Fhc subunit C [Methanobrevibacter cuticularis]
MKTITFNQKETSPIALEFDELIPDEIFTWEKSDFDSYMVPIGNSKFPLSNYFDVEVEGTAESPAEVVMIINGDLGRVKYIGAKMSNGQIVANSSVDLHCGAEMSGGSLLVNGDAESYAGREMTGGELTIKGNVKEFCGASYIGDWRGMTGGIITIEGNAGKQLGECLTGGEIRVKGNCDILAGIHMTKGLIQIDGDVTRWPGGQMQNGDIVINGKLSRSLEGFDYQEVITDPTISGKSFSGKYIKYLGDIARNGKGNLWLNAEKNRYLL